MHSHEPQNPCQGASASTTPRLADPRRHFHLAQSQSVPQTHQREADLACTLPTHAPIRRATSIHCDATSHSVNLQHHADRRKTILRWLAEESIPKALPSPCRTGKEEARVSGRSLYSITLHVLEEVKSLPASLEIISNLIPSTAVPFTLLPTHARMQTPRSTG